MKEVLDGALMALAITAVFAGVISVLVGGVMVLLCLSQWVRGFRPRHTTRLLLSGTILVGTFLYCFVTLADHCKSVVSILALVVSGLAGLCGAVALLRTIPVNSAEMRKQKK